MQKAKKEVIQRVPVEENSDIQPHRTIGVGVNAMNL
jgi:hypothetical protein